MGSDSSPQTTSSSVSAFLVTLILNGLIFLAFVTVFIVIRKRYKRVYEPKTYLETVPERQRIEPSPKGALAWIKPLFTQSQDQLIERTGIDGFFFLRYLRTVMVIFFVGMCITFPILFPVNATGGGGQSGLDVLSITNIADKDRYWAQLLVEWVFLAFFGYWIDRELRFFIKTRQDYVTSPYYADNEFARSILVQSIPQKYLSEDSIKQIYGPNIETVYINRNFNQLSKNVTKRDKITKKLEASENALIRKCNKIARKKGIKEKSVNEKDPEKANSEIWSLYIADKKRPHHRLKPLIGKKVDTIDWSRSELAKLNVQIKEKQESHEEHEPICSVFITYTSQKAANYAASRKIPEAGRIWFNMERTLGPRPSEVLWSSLNFSHSARLSKFWVANLTITAMVIFWAIPVALVGVISNINYLTNKLPWLDWINNIPPVLLGLITGMLPTVMLAVLMMLVPPFLRAVARHSGEPTVTKRELRVQNYYFAFQIIQVFLVTTLASAATSSVTEVIDDPSSAQHLLATDLPKASNFYITYFILFGLSAAGGALAKVVSVVLFVLLSKLLDNTPRKKWTRLNVVGGVGWGIVFPVYTNLACIALVYSIIAPLVMLFAFCAFGLLYMAFAYNFLYCNDNKGIDTTGLIYQRALWQTFTGIYLLEVCLLGIFGIKAATPQIVLEAITIGVTALFQIYLQHKYQNRILFLDTKGYNSDENDGEPLTSKDESDKSNDYYHHPSVTAKMPIVWVPTDQIGISEEEVTATQAAGDIKISNSGSLLQFEKPRLQVSEPPPDYS